MWTWTKKRFQRFKTTAKQFKRDDGTLMAAAVAYYAALALFPLLLVLISVLGVITRTTNMGQNAQKQILDAVSQQGSEVLRAQVADILKQVETGAAVGGWWGALGLLFTAIALFAHFERAFDNIWNVAEQKSKGVIASIKYVLLERARAFLMLCGLGVMVVAVFLSGMTIHAIESVASQWIPLPTIAVTTLEFTVTILLNLTIFALLYRWLPKSDVRWRDAARGAAFVAIGWEIGRYVLANVLIGTKYTNAYGAVGSFLAVMLWLYYISLLIFFGAEYVQVLSDSSGKDED
ncbi:YihY/virulence factor BrkB family protein [Thalassoroseus pseudoceratinae]|uniref:YihY/virulence factor BrkB family protein n=1 Tax=Thalassoroseus pseudoceratinae TaxID=2713176 RepID=UPI0014230E48|nr:YihY/virulence factor BrkB family protein [Thalassoroseus pseudoceratinae]